MEQTISLTDFLQKEGTSLAASEKFMRMYLQDSFRSHGGFLSGNDVEELCLKVLECGYKFGQLSKTKEHGTQ